MRGLVDGQEVVSVEHCSSVITRLLLVDVVKA